MPDDHPPLWDCNLCYKPYVPWETNDHDWNLLPRRYHEFCLCPGCYVRLLAASGHDPEQVTVTHDTWRRLQALWPVRLGRVVHVEFEDDVHLAKVVYILGVRKVILRLLGHGPDADCEVVACWDGESRHPRTGRPVLRAVGRVAASSPSAPRSHRRTP